MSTEKKYLIVARLIITSLALITTCLFLINYGVGKNAERILKLEQCENKSKLSEK